MKTISVDISDELVSYYGNEQIRKLIQDELEYLRFKLLEEKIQKSMQATNVDWDKEFEKAREETFKEYALKRGINAK